ncbi:MAG: hypothetical protein WC277_08480, partial [Bacilli bacterium]
MATLVDTGLEYIAKLINGVSVAPFKYIALGSGTTTEATTDTALATEIAANGLARAEATCGYESLGKATWTHEFTATADGMQINEVGIFDAAAAGNMLMRHKYSST